MCVSLMRQYDAVKQSTRFLLKQLLMNINIEGRKFLSTLQLNETLKNEITHLKQAQATQRLQYEQLHNDMKNRLTARENTIQELNNALDEKEKLLEQFHRLHGKRVVPTPIDTSASTRLDHGSHDVSSHHIPTSTSTVVEPPLKGLLMQRQAQHVAQQQAFAMSNRRAMPLQVNQGLQNNSHQGPFLGNMSSSAASIQNNHTMDSSSMGPQMTGYSRPFNSSMSTGSLQGQAPASRIREITSNTGYKFTSIGRTNSFNSQNNQRINKRRKSDSPSSANGMMSPNTAFLLNQGPQSGTARW
jgi:hypothetical protein